MSVRLAAGFRGTLLVGSMAAVLWPANLGAQEVSGVPDDRNPRPIAEVLARAEHVTAGYADRRLGEFGILDVTRAPYNADPSGARDSTEAIQQAVRDARDARMVAYLPIGTYLVSRTIEAAQRQVVPDWSRLSFVRDDFPCILWGGTQGGRAKLVLADRATGFGDAADPRPVIFVASCTAETPAKLQPNISFNNMIVSLDVDLGEGNPGAIGIDHQGAQGSVTEDCNVNAEGAFAGFRGVSGSGGSASHISVTGGRYGLYLAGLGEMRPFGGSQPSPVISYLTLTGQSERAIYSATRGPLTIVGGLIEGGGIEVVGPPWAVFDGPLNLVDSVVRFRGDGPAISANRPVCLSNAYFEDAEEIVRLSDATVLEDVRGGWAHIVEYAAGPSPAYPVWVNGARQAQPIGVITRGTPPTESFRAAHEWTEPLPSWDDPRIVNVREEPYSASGDGQTDDTAAIQKAMDESAYVFVPKGIYRISQPLRLRPDSHLFGLGVYSIIEPLPEAPAFADAARRSPMLVSPDDADATCTVAFVQLWCRYPGAYAIHWQAGGGSMVRNVRTKPWPRPRDAASTDHPLILIDGKGGGRWYNALMHYKFAQGLDHRHVLVRGTRQPLAFYMLNPEHSAADYMVELDDVRNVRVYAIKSETLGANGPRALTPVLIRNSSDFAIFGHGGNACPPEAQALYRIENCRDFLLANFTYQLYKEGADASTWFIVEETGADGTVTRTPGTECFAAYRRG